MGVSSGSLDHQLDYIIPLKHTGVRILFGRGNAVEIICQPGDILVVRLLGNLGQIHIHHVGRGVNDRPGLLCGGVAGGGAPIRRGASVPQAAQSAEIAVQAVFGRHNHVFYIQAQHSPQSQLLHLVVDVGVHLIEAGWGKVAAPGQMDHAKARQMEEHSRPKHDAGKAYVKPFKAQNPAAKQEQQDGGQKQHQNQRNIPDNRGDDGADIVGQPVARRRS